MNLFNCDIHELVTKQIELFLEENPLTFEELKTLITSKAPIPEVQTQSIKNLTTTKKSIVDKLKKALTEQAYKKQNTDDQTEADHLSQEEKQDKLANKKLLRQGDEIRNVISGHQSDCQLLQLKLAQIIGTAAFTDLKNIGTALKDQSKAIERLKNSIFKIESKIKEQNSKLETVNKELHAINRRERIREQCREQHSNRDQARAAYKATGEGVLDTLSAQNKTQLLKSLSTQYQHIEDKHNEHIKNAELINFSMFLELLPKHFKDLQLSDPETEGLRICIQFMKKHLQAEQQAATIQESLKNKRQSITLQITKLQGNKKNLEQLQKNNPDLKDSNAQLNAQNTELTLQHEHNLNLNKQLSTAGLLLLTFSFLFTIPLILTYCGVIPVFIAPVYLYLLVATPPALFALATIAVGISALVFNYKAQANETHIELNLQTIKLNNSQVKKNVQNLNSLHKSTIPGLEKQIKKEEQLRDDLTRSLQEEQNLAAQALKQAKEIRPLRYSSSSLLKPKKTEDVFVDVPDEEYEPSLS